MCFVIDARYEGLEALRFEGACFVIDIRCEGFEAKGILYGVSQTQLSTIAHNSLESLFAL